MSDCKINDCDKKRNCQGYCNKHYLRWIRHGDPLYRSKVAKNEWKGVKCKILHCETNVKCKGLCKLHYQKYQRGTL
jgi:hypothetical protein